MGGRSGERDNSIAPFKPDGSKCFCCQSSEIEQTFRRNVFCRPMPAHQGWLRLTTSIFESQQTVVDHMATTKGAITVRVSLRSSLPPVIRDRNGMWTS